MFVLREYARIVDRASLSSLLSTKSPFFVDKDSTNSWSSTKYRLFVDEA